MNKDDRGGSIWLEFIIRQVVYSLLAFLGMFVVTWFSRHREYRADLGGAKLAGRDKMLAGLRSLQNTTSLVDNQHEALASFKISGGKKKSSIRELLSTHPPLEERIARLERANIA